MKTINQCLFCGCSFEVEQGSAAYCMLAHAKADSTNLVEVEVEAIKPPAIYFKTKEPTRLDKVKQGRRYSYASHKAALDAELAWARRAKESELRLAAKYRGLVVIHNSP